MVVGRTPAMGEVALAEMKKVSPSTANARFGFIQVDLSVVKGMRQAANEIKHWVGEGGIQYLIQTQGSLSFRFHPIPTAHRYAYRSRSN